jgi:hypothetical protein
MPKANCMLNNTEKYERSNFIDISVYFWVKGIRSIMPTITIDRAILLYVKERNAENFDLENLRNRYTEMQKRMIESEKPSPITLRNGTSK